MASPLPIAPPEPAEPVPVTELTPELAFANPIHSDTANCVAASSVLASPVARAAWVMYCDMSLPTAVALPESMAPAIPFPSGVDTASLSPEFASAAPTLRINATCSRLAMA